MKYIDLINESITKIKAYTDDLTVKIGGNNAQFERHYADFTAESGISFSEDIIELYKTASSIEIEWSSSNKDYGSFNMIPIGDIIERHNDMIEIADSAAEYAVSDKDKENICKLEIIKYLYPIFEFRSGDMFCIYSKTGEAVFYDHSVNELWDLDINGLVIAESFDDLLKKWSRILFLEGFWWEEEYNRCVNDKGIDLYNPFLSEFMKRIE